MKKMTPKVKAHQKRRALYQLKNGHRIKSRIPDLIQTKSLPQKEEDLKTYLNSPRLRNNKERRDFIKKFYRPRKFNKPIEAHQLTGQLGLEHDIKNFVTFSSQIIDSDPHELFLNFKMAERIWPSAVTMFVSLMEWTRLVSSNGAMIRSSNSNSASVNNYLNHCGFYSYVGRKPDNEEEIYSPEEIVKIRRETSAKNTKLRQREIADLAALYSNLDKDDLERFDCKILSEIFVNVTEHGVATNVSGWFILAQYHKRTGIISICIADNGIGIKNSLLTGTQASQIKKLVQSDKDVDYINSALTEYVSGALDSPEIASRMFGLSHRLPQGKKRGMGLKRVLATCKQLNIQFTICSHHGCIALDKNGEIKFKENLDNRCFAGTLYHIILPAKKEIENG